MKSVIDIGEEEGEVEGVALQLDAEIFACQAMQLDSTDNSHAIMGIGLRSNSTLH